MKISVGSFFILERDEIMFKSETHKRNFLKATEKVSQSDYATLAVIYLFSSDTSLWAKTKKKFEAGYVDLGELKLQNLSRNSYAIYSCAKDLELGTEYIILSDLVDSEIVSDQIFNVIVNALKIYRKGVDWSKLLKMD